MPLRSALVSIVVWILIFVGQGGAIQSAEIPARKDPPVVRSKAGVVVSETEIASRVGRDVLAQGGNAVDAAVATALALAVTWPEAGNIGGGGFMMIYPTGARAPVCVDYRETAPAASTATMFAPTEVALGCKASGVPGTIRGLELAHQQFGSLPWAQLVEPSIRLAEEGFTVNDWLAYSTNDVLQANSVKSDDRFASLRRAYGRADGEEWKAGDRMVLPDLAKTLRRVAEFGSAGFYEGPVAELIVAEMERGGGIIAKEDLLQYRAKLREPIRGTYRGYDLIGPPPPSSGGIAVVQALNMLEPLELRLHDRFGSRNMHLITEAMRYAFADRARFIGDPQFTSIPDHLTEKDYAEKLAGQIDRERATPSEAVAPEIMLRDESPQTTHFSVIDRNGMGVSNTYTLESSWGARVVVSGAGFVLNNEMGDFNWVPGHTNRAGRIGTDANLIEPGKRMISSQAPFIVARDHRVVLLTGSPGGRTIINTVLGNLLNVLEFDMTLEAAIAAPRVHHQWFPDELRFEGTNDKQYAESVAQLRAMGHKVVHRGRQGSAHSIQVDKSTGEFIGVADWRRGGAAAGVPE